MSPIVRALRERIESVLARVRPFLYEDGGTIELVDLTDDGVVTLRISGAACGCPMSYMALTAGLESSLLEEIPEIRRVEAVRR